MLFWHFDEALVDLLRWVVQRMLVLVVLILVEVNVPFPYEIERFLQLFIFLGEVNFFFLFLLLACLVQQSEELFVSWDFSLVF